MNWDNWIQNDWINFDKIIDSPEDAKRICVEEIRKDIPNFEPNYKSRMWDWSEFDASFQEGDKIYEFCSDRHSWVCMAGRKGFVNMGVDGKIKSAMITCFS